MSNTTSKRLNFILLQKNGDQMNSRVPKEFKNLVDKTAEKLGMHTSDYVKLAVRERLEKDLEQ